MFRTFRGPWSGIALFFSVFIVISCGPKQSSQWQSRSLEGGSTSGNPVLFSADLNADGVPEILQGSPEDSHLTCWFYSKENQTWQPFRIPCPLGLLAIEYLPHTPLTQTQEEVPNRRSLVLIIGQPSPAVLLLSIPDPDTESFSDPAAWLATPLPIPAGNWSQIATGDFNNDGLLDLVLAGESIHTDLPGHPVVIWLTAPEGGGTAVSIGLTGSALALYTDDMEGDGDLDLLVVDQTAAAGSRGAYWFENPWPDDGSVDWKRNFITLSAHEPQHPDFIDLDGDGKSDLILPLLPASGGTGKLIAFKKLSAAAEVAWLPLPITFQGGSERVRVARLAPLDRDSRLDMVLQVDGSRPDTSSLIWIQQPDKESLALPWKRHLISPQFQGTLPLPILVIDMDGDGKPDVLTQLPGSGPTWFQNPH